LGCDNRGAILCDNCIASVRRAERETDSHIIAGYDYRDPLIKKAVWNLKYYRRIHLGNKLGVMLYDVLLEDISDMREYAKGQPIYVIPVPLSKSRQKVRGYNQADRIARSFCSIGNRDSETIFELQNDVVMKKTNTLPQARIANRNERLSNIKGAFEVKNQAQISGRTIIVIDDVTTTGGTLLEIIKILKKAGAKKVVGFAVAH
jgi:ComF family protein